MNREKLEKEIRIAEKRFYSGVDKRLDRIKCITQAIIMFHGEGRMACFGQAACQKEDCHAGWESCQEALSY